MEELMRRAVTDIEDRRRKQNDKWGDVDGDDRRMDFGTDPDAYCKMRDLQQAWVSGNLGTGQLKWFDILTEEILEALAESEDPENWPALRDELVDAGAVIVAMIESGDLRAHKPSKANAQAD